ncbi:MAG: carboxypeptidase-like regulatory domain-containing protein [Flavobacteriales bacterium]|nr:carboxypeptidase-like regulatory domain-containing protein [Flavobacteriales bacterium]
MQIKAIIFLMVLLPTLAFAGNGKPKSKVDKALCAYSGQVLDKENAETLTGAMIKIVELNKSVYADFDGNFSFQDIPEGDYTIEISFLSYETKTIENFQIGAGSRKKRFFL